MGSTEIQASSQEVIVSPSKSQTNAAGPSSSSQDDSVQEDAETRVRPKVEIAQVAANPPRKASAIEVVPKFIPTEEWVSNWEVGKKL
jgi:hypothetical protein